VSVVACGAVRSCGVTTLALALAATWPRGRRVLLVEIDRAGGTLAAASGWPPEPGLMSLAAAARRDSDPELVWEHCHLLPGGTPVLAGPASADQSQTALAMLGGLLERLGDIHGDVLVDCGRLAGTRPSEVLIGADQVVLVARPRLADLHALDTWLEANRLARDGLGLVLVGDGPYPDAEVAEALGIAVLARLPWDPDAAEGLVSVPATARELKVTPLVRAARTLADRLSTADIPDAAPTYKMANTASTVGLAGVPRRIGRMRTWRSGPSSAATNGATNGSAPGETLR
jgi:MinD-like ATPase involved in chromosome partitioning or flagellar assembly